MTSISAIFICSQKCAHMMREKEAKKFNAVSVVTPGGMSLQWQMLDIILNMSFRVDVCIVDVMNTHLTTKGKQPSNLI